VSTSLLLTTKDLNRIGSLQVNHSELFIQFQVGSLRIDSNMKRKKQSWK
jgi:hypothetical protein